MLENGGDWARELSTATIARPKRVSAGAPQRPAAARPAHEAQRGARLGRAHFFSTLENLYHFFKCHLYFTFNSRLHFSPYLHKCPFSPFEFFSCK